MRRLLYLSAGALLALTVIGCAIGGSDPGGEDAKIVDSDNGGTSGGKNGEGAAAGTRQNPLPPGTAFTVGDWTVELAPTNVDADELVLAENMFNDPPGDGERFVMVEVTTTYNGDDSGTPWIGLDFRFIGADGNTFNERCGVIPDALFDVGEMFPGATASGNVCATVPIDQIDGGAWIVEASFSFDSDRTFVATR